MDDAAVQAVVVGLVSLSVILVVTIVANYSSRHGLLPKELARKLPHVTTGLLAAIWVLNLSYVFIIYFNIAVIIIAAILKKLGIFNHIREVGRISWGEFFIPIGIIVTSLLNPSTWVFCAAMLLMGLADAAAAVVGSQWGKHYFVYMGHKKSIEGSAAFLLVATIITVLLVFTVPSGLENSSLGLVLLFPLIITAVEAFAPFGTDNLFIPVVTATYFTFLI